MLAMTFPSSIGVDARAPPRTATGGMMRRGGARASTPIDDGIVMASINSSLPARTVDGGIVVVTSAEPVVLDDPAGPSLAARLGAEAFGTFGLVLVILGAGLYLPLSNAGTPVSYTHLTLPTNREV